MALTIFGMGKYFKWSTPVVSSHGPGQAGAGVEPKMGHDMLKSWSSQISFQYKVWIVKDELSIEVRK